LRTPAVAVLAALAVAVLFALDVLTGDETVLVRCTCSGR
jgi:hypothetical protein